MSVTVTGDLGKLAELRKNLGRLADVATDVARKVAPRFKGFVEAGFAKKADPYGNAWRPIKAATRKRGTKSILIRAGTMARKVDVLAFGSRVRVLLGVFYARFHISTGRGILPRRGRLPPTWTREIEAASVAELRKRAEGGL